MAKYSKGSTGHDIIDSVVESNRSINPEMYKNAKANPAYFGAVEIGEDALRMASVTKRGGMAELSLISDIIQSVKSLRLNPGDAVIKRFLHDELTISRTHPELIKLIKACLVASYCPSEDFRVAVSGFVKCLADALPSVIVPVGVYTQNEVQKEIVSELEEFLISICESNGIPYQSEKRVKPGKVVSMLKDAEG